MSGFDSNLTAFLLKSTLIVLAMLAVHFVQRRASAATRHLTLSLGMFSLALMPFLSLGLPAWNLEVLPRSTDPAPQVRGHKIYTDDAFDELAFESRIVESAPLKTGGVGAPAALAAPDANEDKGKSLWANLSGFLFPIWLLGTALALAKVGAGLARMRWIVQRGETLNQAGLSQMLDECRDALGLKLRPRLVTSDRIGVPLVWGIFRPAMLFPRQVVAWTPERVRAVMLHELGHLKRADWPMLLLGRIVASVYWFHPLVWCLERCARRECEQACDDLVVNSGTRPSEYAAHLLSIARGFPDASQGARAALAMVRRSHLDSRLRSILDPLLRRGAPSRRATAVVTAAFVIALLPLASMQLAEEAHADEPGARTDVLLAQNSRQQMRRDKIRSEKMNHRTENDEQSSEGKLLFKKAYSLHGDGRYEEAIELFEDALGLNYRPATSQYNIACCYARQGDAGKAVSWLERAQAAGWDDPRATVRDSDFDPIRSNAVFQDHVDQAFDSAGMQRHPVKDHPYRSTLEAFELLSDVESTEVKAWYAVGTKLLMFRELEMATEALNAAVDHSGGQSTKAMYNLACTYSLAGNTRAALEWLERSVEAGFDQHERFLNDPDLNALRGTKEFDRVAERSETLSLGQFPKRGWDDSNYSEVRWAPAIELYSDYVAEHPQSGRAWFNLGWAQHHSRRFEEALASFDKALSLGHRTGVSTYNLACGNAMLGRTKTALDYLEQAVASGAVHPGHMEHDEDLDSLQNEPRFRELIEELEARQHREHDHGDHGVKDKIKAKLKSLMSRDSDSEDSDSEDGDNGDSHGWTVKS